MWTPRRRERAMVASLLLLLLWGTAIVSGRGAGAGAGTGAGTGGGVGVDGDGGDGENNSPQIHLGIPYSETKGVVTLSEEAPVNSLIAILQVKENDTGPAGEVECGTNNDYVGLSPVSPKIYKVELVRFLDRESTPLVDILIECHDFGRPSLTSTAIFSVVVKDVNDNVPTFPEDLLEIKVREGVPIGKMVAQLKAVDLDSEENGEITYTLLPIGEEGDPEYFRIDSKTGKIYTNADIDREYASQLTFEVEAADHGVPSLFSTMIVNVTVLDVNDNAPVVLTNIMHVRENQLPMMAVGTLRAVDLDSGKNGQIVFSKVEDSDDGSSSTAPFLVQPNGKVVAAVTLDRERMSTYEMKILARDRGQHRRSSTAVITIVVDDVNDNTPVVLTQCLGDVEEEEEVEEEYDNKGETDYQYDSGDYGNFTFFDISGFISIDWYSPGEGRVIHRIIASDDDDGENSKLVFAIASINNQDGIDEELNDVLFTVNSSSGELFLRRPVRKTDILTQVVNVSVRDSGNPELATFCALNITVDIDVSELPTLTTTGHSLESSFTSDRSTGVSSRCCFCCCFPTSVAIVIVGLGLAKFASHMTSLTL